MPYKTHIDSAHIHIWTYTNSRSDDSECEVWGYVGNHKLYMVKGKVPSLFGWD